MLVKKVKVLEEIENKKISNNFKVGQEVYIVQDFYNEGRGLNTFFKHCYGLCHDYGKPRTQIVPDDVLEDLGYEDFPDVKIDEEILEKSGGSEIGCVVGSAEVKEEDEDRIFKDMFEQFLEENLIPPDKVEDLKLVVRNDTDGDSYYHWIPESYLEYV